MCFDSKSDVGGIVCGLHRAVNGLNAMAFTLRTSHGTGNAGEFATGLGAGEGRTCYLPLEQELTRERKT